MIRFCQEQECGDPQLFGNRRDRVAGHPSGGARGLDGVPDDDPQKQIGENGRVANVNKPAIAEIARVVSVNRLAIAEIARVPRVAKPTIAEIA